MLQRLCVQTRAVVSHGDNRFASLYLGRDVYGGPLRCVFHGIGDQVAERLAHVRLDAQDDNRLRGVKGDRPAGGRRGGVTAGIGGQDGQVDRGAFRWPDLVQAGQQQQIFHEPFHPGRLLLDPAHDGGLIDPGVLGPQAEQFGETLDRSERGPQFVGGVGQELPEAVLCRVALGEGLLDSRRAWC